MSSFRQVVQCLSSLLDAAGYRLDKTLVPGASDAWVEVEFDAPVFQAPVIAIPDVHLGDAGPGDIFFADNPDKPRRLAAVLRAIHTLMTQQATPLWAIQLGDWFDSWRTSGWNQPDATYGPIQNAGPYREILDLDAQLGLAHIIGNHDASFLNAIPDRRVQQPHLFRLGFWLGKNVYALHGHQSDLSPSFSSIDDQRAVALATTMAKFIPGVLSFEAYIDRLGTAEGIKTWLVDCLGTVRQDPGAQARPMDPEPLPSGITCAAPVLYGSSDLIATVVRAVSRITLQGRLAQVVLVGHTHAPCVTIARQSGQNIVIIDAGSWAYEQSTILIAAGRNACVFDVTPN